LLNALRNLLGEEREGNRVGGPRHRRQGRRTSVPRTGHVWTLRLGTHGSGRKASCCNLFVFASTGNGSARARAAAVALLLPRGGVPLLLLERQPKREGEPPAWARRR
jgi:hypothetical protein